MEHIEYGICSLPAVPMRSDSSHRSEMVSQMLRNETFKVVDTRKDWVKIALTHDGYEGWVSSAQIKAINKAAFDDINAQSRYYTNEPVTITKEGCLTLGTPLFSPDGATELPAVFNPLTMLQTAQKLLGTPYMWGGRTAFGIDCSGFVQICARMAGLQLPRDASQQVNCGEIVYFLQETQPGDLAFFGNENGNTTHVGILMGNDMIIHASGMVRIDFIDQAGIFNKDMNTHTHILQVIKRIG